MRFLQRKRIDYIYRDLTFDAFKEIVYSYVLKIYHDEESSRDAINIFESAIKSRYIRIKESRMSERGIHDQAEDLSYLIYEFDTYTSSSKRQGKKKKTPKVVDDQSKQGVNKKNKKTHFQSS